MSKEILFFADRLPPLIGGVEVHAEYFIKHFLGHLEFPLAGIISKDAESNDCLVTKEGLQPIALQSLPSLCNPRFLFFNSGRWIEELLEIRKMFPQAVFLYRTGGNEIIKAPLMLQQIPDHSLRQAFWAQTMNSTIDLMITNSFYTEVRLRQMGVKCDFKRFVGGVNASALRPLKTVHEGPFTIFCAARFVPYKNHSLLLSVIEQLMLRGNTFEFRLAGDGPLLQRAKEQVAEKHLSSVVKFLGALDNEKVCQEIACADLYMQLSRDEITKVPGGSYIHAEGMGRSILEAVTAGTFVIAGQSGALSEIITEDRGVLIELNHVEEITNKVENIIKYPPGRKAFSDRYSWEKLFASYEELLRDLNANTVSYRKV